ncbi:MAG: DUF1565 domain-containing protein [Nostocaceae cyanobacterium]|nr:DUF1565 domain-containing protein [Nostocaceae cyanobacterium]
MQKINNSHKNLSSLKSLSAGLTALLVASSGLMLLPSGVDANVIPRTGIGENLLAQANTQTVVYVNPQTGSDTAGAGNSAATPYKTISFALQQAQSGTVIQLAPGTYNTQSGENFPLVLKSGVTLQGDEGSKGQGILITGGDFYISPTFARQNVTIRAEDNSVITGVSVTNENTRGTAVWVESTNPTIKNSTFSNSAREGVFVTGVGNPKIENNIFVNNSANGVSIAKSARGEIRGNLFQNTGFGLAIGGNSTPLVVENQVIENRDGMFISNDAKPVLRKNVIENNTRDGIVVISNAAPDLGTNAEPGGNIISNNKQYDLNNATRGTIVAIGNQITKMQGNIEYIAGDVDRPPVAFKDVPASHWASKYIEALSSSGVIAGFPDGTFKPDDKVTRAQYAAIITKAFAPGAKRAAINFKDVSSNFWAYQAIQTASRGGFLAGYPDRSFKPQQQIPRVQAFVSLANGLELSAANQNSLTFYNDASQIPDWAKDSVAAATVRQVVVNYPVLKQLNPNRDATRAELAAAVYQALVNAGRAEAIPSPYVVSVPDSGKAASLQK